MLFLHLVSAQQLTYGAHIFGTWSMLICIGYACTCSAVTAAVTPDQSSPWTNNSSIVIQQLAGEVILLYYEFAILHSAIELDTICIVLLIQVALGN